MRSIKPHLFAISAAACCFSSAVFARTADSPFDKLKTYDFQNRTPADAISDQIKQANGDRQKLGAIEAGLDGVLDDATSTFAGKQEACRLLSIIGTGICVPSLSRLLADEHTADMARYALERDSDPSAAKALRAAVAHAPEKTRVGLINSLGDRADPLAPGILKLYIKDKDEMTAEAAIASLGKIGNPDAIAILNTLPDTNVSAGNALLRAAGQLAASGSEPRAAAIYLRLAKEGRPALVRAEAVRGLSVVNAAGAAPAAISALKSNDAYLQEVAARVIGTIGTGAAVNPAMEMWPKLEPNTQIVLLTAFADRRDRSALPMAFTAIESKDAALREAGIRSAALMGGAAVVSKLVYILLHGEGDDRRVARESLASMPGAEAEREILRTVKAANAETRAALLPVLGERPTAGAMAILLESAADADSIIAVPALQALGRVGREQTFGDVLKVLVTTAGADVRDAARDAAGAISHKLPDHGAAAIYAVLDSASDAARAALYPMLAEIADERALNELTKSSNAAGVVRQAAISSLADNWPDARAMPRLLEIAQTDDDKNIRVQALRGYLRILVQDDRMPAEDKVSRIQSALAAAARPEEKRQALSVLRDCRTVSAMEAAAKLLDEPDLFNDAANTVIYLAGPQRKNDKDQPAVIGPAATAALDRVIRETKDDNQRNAAQKLRGS